MMKRNLLVGRTTHLMAFIGFFCLALMVVVYGDIGAQGEKPIHYYIVSGLGAIGFAWLMVALCIDAWKRFGWPLRVVIIISFLLLSVLSLSLYYLFLVILERRTSRVSMS